MIPHSNQLAGTIGKTVGASLTLILLLLIPDHAAGISVHDHGARGDGKNDDAPAIRAAIASVARAGGGTVHFPAGTYLLKTSEPGGQLLTLPSGVHLVSDEAAELVDTGHPSAAGDEWEQGPLLRAVGAADCEIRGLHFSGPGQAIYMQNVRRFVIRDCRFKGHSPMSIYGDRTSDVEVRNCHFEHAGYGLYLRSPVRWRVLNCRFLANGRAIEAQGALSCEISGNFVDGKGPDGRIHGIVGFLFFPNSKGPRYGSASTIGNLITNNEVRNVREEGISLDCRGNAPRYYYGLPGMVAAADRNSFTDASNEAEELKPAPTCYVVILSGRGAGQYRLVKSVQGKTLSISPAWDVIPDETSRYCLLRAAVKNKIIGNKVAGVHLASIMLWGACLDNEVRGNIVDSPSNGIHCGSLQPDVHNGMARVLACFDNRILNNQVSGIGDTASGKPESGIVLRNWYGDAGEVQNYRNSVTGNVISNFSIGINVSAQNSTVVRGNTFKHCDVFIKQGDHLTNCIIE